VTPATAPWTPDAPSATLFLVEEQRGLPGRREVFIDDRGAGLRLTWHADQMTTVVSLWREDVCIGTFHLEPLEAARVIEFLSSQLAEVAADLRSDWSASA
jgi:hypothetical protein